MCKEQLRDKSHILINVKPTVVTVSDEVKREWNEREKRRCLRDIEGHMGELLGMLEISRLDIDQYKILQKHCKEITTKIQKKMIEMA